MTQISQLERSMESSIALSFGQELRHLVKALHDHSTVAITNREGRILYVNEQFSRLSGYTSRELIGQNPRVLNSGYHDELFFKKLWNTVLSGQVWRGEIRNKSKSGEYYWTRTTITPFRDSHSNVYRFVAVLTDITTRVKCEESIRQKKEEIDALVFASPLALAGTDSNGNIAYWNPAAEELFQKSSSKVIRKPLFGRILHKSIQDGFLNEPTKSVYFTWKDREIEAFCSSYGPKKKKNIYIFQDVSKRRQLEKMILDASEREKIKIGHELHDVFGQNLMGMSLRCKALQKKTEKKCPEIALELLRISSEIADCVGLARSMATSLCMVHIEENGLKNMLIELAADTERLYGIQCDLSYITKFSFKVAVSSNLYRIVQEAVFNAVKHSNCTLIEVKIEDLNPGVGQISIADNGKGIKWSEMKKGMGLSILEYRARLLNGSVQFGAYHQGKGTRIVCKFPVDVEITHSKRDLYV